MNVNKDNILKKILMPVDIDGDNTQAVQLMKCVALMLDQHIEKITLLHVTGGKYLSEHMVNIDVRAGQLISTEQFKKLRQPYIETHVKPVLEKISQELKSQGIKTPVDIMVLDGEPVDQIVKTVNESGYTSLVLQRSDKSTVASMFVGSVAAGILHRDVNATIYLSAAHGTAPLSCPPTSCLVAVDGSKNSREALDRACLLAQACGENIQKIIIAHVLDTAKFSETLTEGSEQTINVEPVDDALNKLLGHGIPENKIIRSVSLGEPAEVLSDLVKEHNVDLIIMGRRERGALKELFMGSVSSRIISRCPSQTIVLVTSN